MALLMYLEVRYVPQGTKPKSDYLSVGISAKTTTAVPRQLEPPEEQTRSHLGLMLTYS